MDLNGRAKKEIIVIIASTIAMIFALCCDMLNICPSFIQIKLTNIEALGRTLFTVQSTMLATSIAVLALLMNYIQRYYFGVSVSKYIMHLRPFIFKHSRIIFISLVIVALNYLTLSFELYNCLIAFLFISIIILLVMLSDVVRVLTSTHTVAHEIKDYIVKSKDNKVELLEAFRGELIEAAETNNFIVTKRDSEFILYILENSKQDNELITSLENIFCELTKTVYNSGNENLYLLIINSIVDLYKLANTNDITLNIYSQIENEILKIISTFDYQKYNEARISILYYELYKNCSNLSKTNELRNKIYSLKYFSSRLYYYFFVYQHCDFLEEHKKNIKARLFQNIRFIIFSSSFSDGAKDIAKTEMKCFYKALIDQGDIRTFKSCLINYDLKDYNEITMQVIIYLYYLAYKEKEFSNDNNKLKDYALLILKDYHNILSNVIRNYISLQFREHKNSIDEYKVNLSSWEIIPTNTGKYIIMDNVVDEFFIFSIVFCTWNTVQLEIILKDIIGENPFIYYSQFAGNFKNYYAFIKGVFNESYKEAKAKKEYDEFKLILTNIYKNYEVEKGKAEILKIKDKSKFETNIKRIVDDEINHIFKFCSLPNKEEYIRENLHFYSIDLLTTFMDDDFIHNHLRKELSKASVSMFIYLIKQNIKLKNIDINNDNKLTDFFAQFDKQSVDLIIGNGDSFYGDSLLSEYKDFIINKKHIKQSNKYMSLYAIDSNQVQISLNEVSVVIRDFTNNEILNSVKRNNDGDILYNVTNDIYLPFTNDELIDHIKNIRKILDISVVVHLNIKSSEIGGGIELDLNNL